MSPSRTHNFRSRKHRGAALMITLVLTLCLTMLIAATQMMIVTQLKAEKGQRDYDRALELADAGANAYLNYLSSPNPSSITSLLMPWTTAAPPTIATVPSITRVRADILAGNIKVGNGSNIVNGTTYASTMGFVSYPAQATLTTKPAVNSQFGYFVIVTATSASSITVASYGYANGIVRRVQIAANASQGGGGNFAAYGINTLTTASNVTINGNIGTDGTAMLSSNDTVAGTLYLTGTGATVSSAPGSIVSRRISRPLTWPTVDQIANKAFPAGGLTWLSTHNDNALCSAISGNVINLSAPNTTATFGSKAGGANYYLTSMAAVSNTTIVFDNSLGPITIWVGPGLPTVGTGGVSFSSNVTFSETSTNPAYLVQYYLAATGSSNTPSNAFSTNSNITATINVYAYNKDSSGTAYGSFSNHSNLTFNGSIIAYDLTMSSNTSITYPSPPGIVTAAESTNFVSQIWKEIP